jgi:N-acetyl-beta-hexosaminidase
MRTSGFFRHAIEVAEQQVIKQLATEAHKLHQANSQRPISVRKPNQLQSSPARVLPGPASIKPQSSSLKAALAQTRRSSGTVSLEQRAREQFNLLFKQEVASA